MDNDPLLHRSVTINADATTLRGMHHPKAGHTGVIMGRIHSSCCAELATWRAARVQSERSFPVEKAVDGGRTLAAHRARAPDSRRRGSAHDYRADLLAILPHCGPPRAER